VGDYVTSKHSGRTIQNTQLCAKQLVNLLGEKSDLAFVIFAKSKKAISLNALPSHTINLVNLLDRMIRWFFPMMAKEVVARRDVKMPNIEFN
jgi:hypothetical protein